ncbi:MAG: hypothetical protein NTU98_08205 [Bacteroidetes bacterium]|nr:hypothetical protein [Bacteroidota bacterium]
MKNLLLLICLLASLLLNSCRTCKNEECRSQNFDCECCPFKDTTIKPLPKAFISRINIFLETSGSMEGYMPPSLPSTKFQIISGKVISKLNDNYQNKVYFFSIYNSKSKFYSQNLTDARKKIRDGGFAWSGSTYIPTMLDSIKRGYFPKTSVNIFISDFIFSPEVRDQKQKDYTDSDISNIFKPFSDSLLTTSLICLFSDFRNKIKCDSSPYYFLIQGKPENLIEIKKLLSHFFQRESVSFKEINFGLPSSKPFYSVLPNDILAGNYTPEICPEFDSAYLKIDGIEFLPKNNCISFWVGINLSQFPFYSYDTGYLRTNLELKIGAKEISFGEISQIPEVQSLTEKSKCTHFFKINILDLTENVSKLNISLKDKPNWMSAINHDDYPNREKIRLRTYGLNNIIKGLEEAYNVTDTRYLFKDLQISLIKK